MRENMNYHQSGKPAQPSEPERRLTAVQAPFRGTADSGSYATLGPILWAISEHSAPERHNILQYSGGMVLDT